jgi:hypothetical protein
MTQNKPEIGEIRQQQSFLTLITGETALTDYYEIFNGEKWIGKTFTRQKAEAIAQEFKLNCDVFYGNDRTL